MQQQQGRSVALHYYIDSHAVDGETPRFEILEHHDLVSGEAHIGSGLRIGISTYIY